jgi:hypothetical protein
MALQVLPSTIRLEHATLLQTPIRPQCLMRPLVLTQVRAIRAREAAEAAAVRLVVQVQR